jgi:hypothetical protein
VLRRAVFAAFVACSLGVIAAPAARAEGLDGRDWRHALYVVADLSTRPVTAPTVVLLGGSAGRECTIGDRAWGEQIASRGGPAVVAHNLSSRNQSFAQDLHLVSQLPRTPTLVFIGVNSYRFCASHNAEFVTDTITFGPEAQHHYSERRVLSEAEKKQIARDWVPKQYPKFDERFYYNLGMLELVIKECLDRGFRPVLLDLPRNVDVIGDRLDLPVGRYSRACLEISARYDIPFVSFVTGAGLTSSDFFDNAHLVETGRAKYQRVLSDTSVGLLREYGMAVKDRKAQDPVNEVADWSVSPWSGLPAFLLRAETAPALTAH